MKLTITTYFWFPKLQTLIRSWFDFRVDLAGLTFGEEDVTADLGIGRE
jgi:hypothetical protein